MVKVLFVCLGNICRSPSAEGVFRHMVDREGLADHIGTDSAGTSSWHIGEAPDSRAREAAHRRGYSIDDLRARQVAAEDFHRFDYVLAMDDQNHANLDRLCPPGREDRLHMLMDFADTSVREVPDPYYGGPQGFDTVLTMIEEASAGLLADIRARHL